MVSTTAENDGLFESVQVRLGLGQVVVEPRQFLLEEHFGLVSLGREWVKGVGEAVVENGQLGNAFSRNAA
jgi:hypothetical protein